MEEQNYLADCPCCDGKAEIERDEWGAMVRCTNCGLNTGGEFGESKRLPGDGVLHAISFWNRRVTINMSATLSLTPDEQKIAEVIKNFEYWMQKTSPNVKLGKTVDEGYPVYEDQLAMALFGAFFAGHELS